MKLVVFSAHEYDKKFFTEANDALKLNFDLVFLKAALLPHTAILADGATAVCAFVNDQIQAATLEQLAQQGVKFLVSSILDCFNILQLMRCAGFNNVDLDAAERVGIQVARVPAYSPYAVAEHAMALILTLNRKIHRAYARVRESNFSLDGLLGNFCKFIILISC